MAVFVKDDQVHSPEQSSPIPLLPPFLPWFTQMDFNTRVGRCQLPA